MGSIPAVSSGGEVPAGLRGFSESGEWAGRARSATTWHLLLEESVNHPDLQAGNRIRGQFTPQQFSHELGANVPDVGGFSRTNPLVQWIGGSVETLTFEARLFSEHRNDQTAANKLETLKLLRQAHEPLGRPPITRFFWGRAIPDGMPCFVRSLGGISYDEIRMDTTIRGVSLNITLVRFTPFRVIRVMTSSMEQTPVHVAKHAETYEMIAHRKWGDPMLGVPLRQQNPRFPMNKDAPRDYADLRNGEKVKLLSKRDLTAEHIRPQCHIFDEDDMTAADNRRYFFNKRGQLTGVMPRR